MERIVVVARLKPGSQEQAKELLEGGPPYDLAAAGFQHHAVYLSDDEVVFVFEGAAIDQSVRDLVNDPVRSATFSVWGPLLADGPRIALERFSWTSS
jgi:hypothetical protein